MKDKEATAEEVLAELRAQANAENVAGMARFGINAERALGISMVALRQFAKPLKRDHALAAALWASGVHEARILASLIDEPKRVTPSQMERWARDLDSWDLTDQVCGNLFLQTPYAYNKAVEWSGRSREFVKRAGFTLMAQLAVHDKAAPDEAMQAFLPIIEREAADERNYVRKAVNWALRQIGKRDRRLNAAAVETARRIQQQDSRSARWVAADALRELTSEKTQAKLKR